MKEEEQQHEQLRNYLLGRLNEEEREKLAEEYFVNDDLFDKLLEVENEFFDQYARQELSPQERKQFAQYINSLPDGKAKLATSMALVSLTQPEPEPWWKRLFEILFSPKLVPVYALGMIILVGFFSLIYFYNRQNQIESDQVQVPETEKNIANQPLTIPSPPPANQNSNLPNIQPETNKLPQNQPSPKAQPTKPKPPKEDKPDTKPPIQTTIASLVLTPALRSSGVVTKLPLKPKNKIVSLSIQLNPNEKAETYRAILQNIDGSEQDAFEIGNLKHRGTPQNRRVKVKIPAQKLTKTNYKLTLEGLVKNQVEFTTEFYFEVSWFKVKRSLDNFQVVVFLSRAFL
jgi:hypothetical protein